MSMSGLLWRTGTLLTLATAGSLGRAQTTAPIMSAPSPVWRDSVHVYPKPTYSNVVSAGSTTVQGGQTQVTVQLGAVPQVGGDAFVVVARFNNGLSLAACSGSATIPGSPGQVALVGATRTHLASGQASLNATTLTITAPSPALAGATLLSIETYYAPYYLTATEGNRVLSGGIASVWRAPGSPTVFLTTSLFGDDPPYQLVPRPGVPHDFPRIPPLPGTPKPGDFNGDGRPGWDTGWYAFLPDLGDVFVSEVITDRPGGPSQDSMITVIDHDTNGNGQLDPSEVSAVIGQCVFVPGLNAVYVEEIDGVEYVHHLNKEDGTNNGFHYIYNTQTGLLKVYDMQGNPIYFGPPDGYGGWRHR